MGGLFRLFGHCGECVSGCFSCERLFFGPPDPTVIHPAADSRALAPLLIFTLWGHSSLTGRAWTTSRLAIVLGSINSANANKIKVFRTCIMLLEVKGIMYASCWTQALWNADIVHHPVFIYFFQHMTSVTTLHSWWFVYRILILLYSLNSNRSVFFLLWKSTEIVASTNWTLWLICDWLEKVVHTSVWDVVLLSLACRCFSQEDAFVNTV